MPPTIREELVRVSCLQENLAKGLSIVGRAVSTRSTLPVLGNILLEARNNQLRLAATNFEISVSCWIGAKVDEEGAITVPARLLTDFVNSLPPERIDMALTVRTQTLDLRCARYNATMKGIDAAEFPIIATMTSDADDDDNPVVEGTAIALETAGLRKMIDQVIFAASSDESRPTLTGVEVRFQEDRLSMAATDGYRLSVRSVPLDVPVTSDDLTVIIPAKSLGELARVSADADEEQPVHVLVTEERNQILFQLFGKDDAKGSFRRVELVSQLIDARYPDYRAIIPDHFDTRTVVSTEQFLKAVRVAILFARDNANIIKLALAPGNGSHSGQVRLTASSSEMGDSVNDIDADVNGNELEIAFNARYLIDVLSQIDEPQVILETTQATRPGALRPVGMGAEEFLHVVMPMHQPR
ncbi:MAG: DNA polymerase III subunit beta [Caldilineaceae bacterium]|nr:DNA polymerase III subunit beta [Caldilineaceae bacterium]